MSRERGFSLVELLVVIGIIGLLMAIVIPALSKARHAARSMQCLTNMRGLEQAHWGYMADHNGRFVDIGLGEGGSSAGYDQDVSWISTLAPYYDSDLLRRSPLDDSPHWAPEFGDGEPTPSGEYRRTSYGVNSYLAESGDGEATRLSQVPQPARTVHFLMMAFEGDFAAADHPHVEDWYNAARPERTPLRAAQQSAIGAHGGTPNGWDAQGVYGFLDGSAKVMAFEEVFESHDKNLFRAKANIW